MRTFWIYYSGQPVTGVRLPLGSSEAEIRNAACRHSDIFCNRPLEAPFEFELKCRHGEIRVFDR